MASSALPVDSAIEFFDLTVTDIGAVEGLLTMSGAVSRHVSKVLFGSVSMFGSLASSATAPVISNIVIGNGPTAIVISNIDPLAVVSSLLIDGVAASYVRVGSTVVVDLASYVYGIHVVSITVDGSTAFVPFISLDLSVFVAPAVIESKNIVSGVAASHVLASGTVITIPAQAASSTLYFADLPFAVGYKSDRFVFSTDAVEIGPIGTAFSPFITVSQPVKVSVPSDIVNGRISTFQYRGNKYWVEVFPSLISPTSIESRSAAV